MTPLTWFLLGAVSGPALIFFGLFAVELISDWRRSRSTRVAMRELCGNCYHRREIHQYRSLPDDPFREFLACPRLTYLDNEEQSWKDPKALN